VSFFSAGTIDDELKKIINNALDAGRGHLYNSEKVDLLEDKDSNGKFFFQGLEGKFVPYDVLTVSSDVPEPGSLVLLGSGLVCLLGYTRARKKRGQE
jgi:hypothetical protein